MEFCRNIDAIGRTNTVELLAETSSLYNWPLKVRDGKGAIAVIPVTRLNGQTIIINLDLIETLEQTPDTVITLTNGKKFVVRESVNEIVAEIVRFKRLVSQKIKK